MTRFYPVYVRRSDGKLEVVTKKGTEKNEPTPEQLDRTPNAKGVSDYYREIAYDEVKHLDWRRKLAGMLLREIGGKEYQDKAVTAILQALPENYRLYEHIKSRATDKDGKAQKSAKNHAGGGHDRQDAYLYGHPMGAKKRFRSPADFFPHLLWLVTDPAGDVDNCSCKICCPEELDEKTGPGKDTKATTPVKKEDTTAKSPSIPKETVTAVPASVPPRTTTTPRPIAATAPPAVQPPQPPQPAAPPTLKPTPLPQPRSVEQQIDAQYNKFIFRPGEMIWFHRESGAWGLGVITRRYQQQNTRVYLVQPLSHPFRHNPIVTVTQEKSLRPWLAWSPPACTYQSLNEHPTTYEQADWTGLVTGKYGHGDPEVDGSILAAKSIDDSYTTLEFLKKVDLRGGMEERRWNGLYLGGEKIWAGEPVRLRIASGNDIMVITEIVELCQANRSTVYLVGDVYSFTMLEPGRPLPDDRYLPHRMREDLRWRNQVALRAKKIQSYWKLMAASARLDITDIKGRWYESSLLMPILQDPSQFAAGLQSGNISDAGAWMNARGDCNPLTGQRTPGKRTIERQNALGKAVPADTRIQTGIDPPPQSQPPSEQIQPPMQLDAAHFPNQHHQDQLMQDPGHDALDQFMNLDGMDHDSMPGFGPTYGSQNNTFF